MALQPVFPQPIDIKEDPCSSDSSEDVEDRRPYMERLKERNAGLMGLPEVLCPPSREPSPGFEERVGELRREIRSKRGLDLSTRMGVRGGDWVGETVEESEKEVYILPMTEKEWFVWDKRRRDARDRRRKEEQIGERMREIEEWSKGIRVASSSAGKPLSPAPTTHSVVSAPPESQDPLPSQEQPSDPTGLNTPPAAPHFEPLLDFAESLSGTAPSLPFGPSQESQQQWPFPNSIPFSSFPPPSFNLDERYTSTPRHSHIHGTNPQLSSPISPPRLLRPLHDVLASQMLPPPSPKRTREGEEWEEGPSTPRQMKRHKGAAQPITPTSVPRPPTGSQASQQRPPDIKRLPTLTELLASSKKTRQPRMPSPTLRESEEEPKPSLLEFLPSQPDYSTFKPPFESTQRPTTHSAEPRQHSRSESQSSFHTNTTGGGFGGFYYQSQFNVEEEVQDVSEFLNRDVWELDDTTP